jgi:hypothetical protein
VIFIFGRDQFQGRVREGDWTGTAIRTSISDDASGVVRMEGLVEVRNRLGRIGTRRIRFEPILETSQIPPETSHGDCWGLIGYRGNATHYSVLRLQNQWTVASASLGTFTRNNWEALANAWEDLFGYRVGGDIPPTGGCRTVDAPLPGRTDPRYTLEVWCNAYSRVECTTWVTIEGPRGTRHY